MKPVTGQGEAGRTQDNAKKQGMKAVTGQGEAGEEAEVREFEMRRSRV